METATTLPLFLILAAVVGLAILLLVITRIFNPRQYIGPVQRMPYESGMDPIHDTRRRFDVRFHLIAIAFLVFDVEVLFLYPWAVAAKKDAPAVIAAAASPVATAADASSSSPVANSLSKGAVAYGRPRNISAAVGENMAGSRHLVFGGVTVFFVLLALGFIYDWRKGVFQWR